MKRCQFRDILRMFCKEHEIKIPKYEERTKLFHAYQESLSTASVPDDEDTLNQFLMNTNWTEIFMDKKNMCAVTATNDIAGSVKTNWFKLAPLPKAVPQLTESIPSGWTFCKSEIKEEGKTPMRYNDNYASASANVITAQSDTAVQRDYLLGRLDGLVWPKQRSFPKLFNLNIDNTPRTYKALIDAIKNDKFTLDAKLTKKVDQAIEDEEYPEDYYPWGPFFGIDFEGPKADTDGHNEALKELSKRKDDTRDVIMSGVYADGLKALQDFEAWLPVGKSN